MRLALIALTLLLTACAPVADRAADLLDRADGAQVLILSDGVGFDSGATPALGTILIVIGDDLALQAAPEGATCSLVEDVIDCRLGDVSGRVAVLLTGKDVLASATFRRAGGTGVYQAITR